MRTIFGKKCSESCKPLFKSNNLLTVARIYILEMAKLPNIDVHPRKLSANLIRGTYLIRECFYIVEDFLKKCLVVFICMGKCYKFNILVIHVIMYYINSVIVVNVQLIITTIIMCDTPRGLICDYI